MQIEDKVKLYYNGKKTTYHTYRYKRKPTIKPVYWYVMSAPKQRLIPEESEDITKAIWVKKKDLHKYYDGAYKAIVDVLKSII